MSRQGWTGTFLLKQGEKEWTVFNEIRDYGRQLTFELWTGQTDERFSGFRLLTRDCRAFAGKQASFSVSGEDLISKALFTSSEVRSVPVYLQLVSTLDRVIAETELPDDLNADEAIQIERRDTLRINA